MRRRLDQAGKRGLVLNSKSDLDSRRFTFAGDRRGGFCVDLDAVEKIYAGTGGNKLLILYLVFAATITTRYRKLISG
ncbi:hypothetical protein CCGE531_08160 [Rhizobium sp. CCGE531]|nr:hypothetical protein CCGE531_08160 [Rhizobium sp. CCGE531]AYG72461.1 hypothetical protein CCGE532_08180 [Rhizobium sp. CCGE532]